MPEYSEYNWATEIDNNTLFFDSNNNLWLGGNGDGVYFLPSSEELFNVVTQKLIKNFTLKSVRSFYEYKDNIYIGGYSGLVKMNKQTKKFSDIHGEFVPFCMEPYPDDSAQILIGSEGEGLIKYDIKNKQFERLSNKWFKIEGYEKPWLWIFDIYNDGDSLLWFGARQGILKYSIADQETQFFENNDSNDFKFGEVFSIYRDFNGRLFAGCEGSGLLSFNEENQCFVKYCNPQNPQFDFAPYRINQITQTDDSIYWISTDQGLIRIDDDQIKIFSKEDGLLNDFVYAVIPDDNNKLWMSTNDGIFCYNRTNGQMTSFSINDRLQAHEFNTSAYFKSKNGTIYFGGVNGFNYFNPNHIYHKKKEIPIEIIGFYLFNQEQKLDRPEVLRGIYEIPADVEYFKLEFAAINYQGNAHFRYKYKVKELNTAWIDLNFDNELGFHKMTPGRYQLQILAADQHGNWNSTPKTVTIFIKSHFWETKIFKYGSVLFLVVLVIIILNYRYVLLKQQKIEIENTVKKRTMDLSIVNDELKKANDTKDKFLAIMSHDIKNPLSAAKTVSSDLMENAENYTKEERELLLGILNRSMEHLLSLLEDLGSWAQLQNKEIKVEFEKCELKESIKKNIELFSVSLLNKNIDMNEMLEKNIYLLADCKMIDSIFRNLLSNAIKFSYLGSVINVSAQRKADYVEIQIEDNGVGMTEEQVNNLFIPHLTQSLPGTENEKGTGFGLLLVYQFVNLNKGKIEIISEPKHGTRFILTFPAENKKAVS